VVFSLDDDGKFRKTITFTNNLPSRKGNL
jgi:hypothetical protein